MIFISHTIYLLNTYYTRAPARAHARTHTVYCI